MKAEPLSAAFWKDRSLGMPIGLLRILPAFLLVAVLIAGCGAAKDPPPGDQQPHPVSAGTHVFAIEQAPMPIAAQMEGVSGIVALQISDTGFNLSRLAVTVGERVKIYIRNVGTKPHNLVIPRFRIVTQAVAPGADNYVEFTADERGEWPYYSDVPGQEEPGLFGILKVE